MSLSAHNVKVQIMYKIDKWIRFTRKVKSPTSLLQGPQESSLTVEGSIQRKPGLFIIRFLNGSRRLKQFHGELKGPVMPSETSLTKRPLFHLHQAVNSTSVEPSEDSTSSQAKISFMRFFLSFFCLSSFCLLILNS
jgi:hypothetical protein